MKSCCWHLDPLLLCEAIFGELVPVEMGTMSAHKDKNRGITTQEMVEGGGCGRVLRFGPCEEGEEGAVV